MSLIYNGNKNLNPNIMKMNYYLTERMASLLGENDNMHKIKKTPNIRPEFKAISFLKLFTMQYDFFNIFRI